MVGPAGVCVCTLLMRIDIDYLCAGFSDFLVVESRPTRLAPPTATAAATAACTKPNPPHPCWSGPARHRQADVDVVPRGTQAWINSHLNRETNNRVNTEPDPV